MFDTAAMANTSVLHSQKGPYRSGFWPTMLVKVVVRRSGHTANDSLSTTSCVSTSKNCSDTRSKTWRGGAG